MTSGIQVKRFDANCYLHILDKIDSHDISRGRSSKLSESDGIKDVLGLIEQRTLVIGIPSDGIYPFSEQMALYKGIPHSVFVSLESNDVHDGFLLETEQLNNILLAFL